MERKKGDLIPQRRIEAKIASALIGKLALEVGSEKAFEIASETIRDTAADAGRRIFTKLGCITLAELAHVVRTIWDRDNVLEIEFLKETAGELFFNVRRCGYAEMYKKSGLSDFGYCLSCNRDNSFVAGFNPGLESQHHHPHPAGMVVPKAALLAACCRVFKIPARLAGYADVRNHLCPLNGCGGDENRYFPLARIHRYLSQRPVSVFL